MTTTTGVGCTLRHDEAIDPRSVARLQAGTKRVSGARDRPLAFGVCVRRPLGCVSARVQPRHTSRRELGAPRVRSSVSFRQREFIVRLARGERSADSTAEVPLVRRACVICVYLLVPCVSCEAFPPSSSDLDLRSGYFRR